MANEIVEKNQRETHEEVVAKYIFECTGGGVTEPVRSPEKEALKPGIRLHFLRYGLFDKNADDENEEDVTAPVYENSGKQCNAVLLKEGVATYAKLKKETENTKGIEKLVTLSEVEVLSLKKMPKLKHFSTARTALNTGYIYLINDEDPNDYYELKVDETGLLQHVLWEYNKDAEGNYLDQREATGSKVTYKLVQPGKKLWAAYSPTQWSRAYHHELNMDAEKRKERMVLIDCSGIKKGAEQEHKHVIPFKDVRAVFPKGHPRAIPLQQMLHQIHADEKKQDEKGANEIFEDLFVTLHDPIGCASDIGEVVSQKTLKLQAITRAIQSGESFEAAFEKLLNKEIEAPKPKKEYGELFSLAHTCYKLVYSDEDAILKYDGGSSGFNFEDRHSLDPRPLYVTGIYRKREIRIKKTSTIGYGLDYKKIEGILGIKERNSARKEIIKYRDDLGKMFTSAYMRVPLDDYLGNHPERFLMGRNVLQTILDPLRYHPYKHDQHLMLEKEYKEKDKWLEWIYHIIDENCPEEFQNKEIKSKVKKFEGMDPFYALLATPFNADKLLTNVESFSQKLAGVYKKNLKYRASQVADLKEIDGVVYRTIAEKKEFIVAKMNMNIKAYGHEMVEIIDEDIWLKLEKEGLEIDPEYAKKGRYRGKKKGLVRFIKEEIDDGIQYTKRRIGRRVENKVIAKVRQNLGNQADLDPSTAKKMRLDKLVNGKAFNGVFALLELYNFNMAVFKTMEEDSTAKDDLYAIGTALKLAEASMSLAKVTIISEEMAKGQFIRGASTFLTAAGGAVTVGWCAYDAYKAMEKGDIDASSLLIGACFAFTASSMASLGIIFATTGPVGWVGALIGVGLVIVAALLSDNEVETLFKNFLLSDRKAFPKPKNMSPMKYIGEILEKREELTPKEYHSTLMNPLEAQIKLFDYIVCKEIVFAPLDYENTLYPSMGKGMMVSYEKATSFSAKMVFTRFFNHPKQVETYGYLYPRGVKRGKPIPMYAGKAKAIYDTKNNKALEVIFSVPDEYHSEISIQSEAVFILRLEVDKTKNMYFPYPLKGKERYLGAKIRLHDISMFSDLWQKKDIVIDTLSTLKTSKPW
ncbi:toxin VasX [Tenacibaculum maritimum]|uniref:toxin VasX n=1 Tax=Tenacibaculum maritimum TaxID=107401 RepID=UPI00388D9755